MKFRLPKLHNSYQFIATILVVAIATVWVGLLGNYIWQQMQPEVIVPPADFPVSSGAPATAPPSPGTVPNPTVSATPLPSPTSTPVITTPVEPDNPQPTAAPAPSPSPEPANIETRYGHFYYPAAVGELVEVGKYYDRPERMVSEAANAFWQMQDAAAASGIRLGPISGYRTVEAQVGLFDRQIQRQGGPEAASRLSAPPGYSEHHTGFTIDIRDLDQPDTDLKYSMADTAAYRWLIRNACDYGFELSFPDGNQQGVSFEPWHWRYIGSATARQVFAAARQRFPYPTNCP